MTITLTIANMNKCLKISFYKIIFIMIGFVMMITNTQAQVTATVPAETNAVSLWSSPLFWVFFFAIIALLIVIIAIGSVLVGLVNNKLASKIKNTSSIVLILLSIGIGTANAQSTSTANAVTSVSTPTVEAVVGSLDPNTIIVLLVVIFIELFVILYLYSILQKMLVALGYKTKDELTWTWSWFYKKMTKAVPLEKESEVATDHNYDGIIELDNSLPPWWVYMFYATIVFSFVYIIYFQFMDGPDQIAEYDTAVAEAAIAKNAFLTQNAALVDENTVTYLSAANDLSKGKMNFVTKCSPCHGQNGEGGVGPNLTDDYWINGGDIKSIFKIIKYGKQEKGMISWESQIKPLEMQQLSSYIKSIHGSNPGNPKAAQGTLYVESATIDSTKIDSTQKTTNTIDTTAVASSK